MAPPPLSSPALPGRLPSRIAGCRASSRGRILVVAPISPEEVPLDLHGLLALDEFHDSFGVSGIGQGPCGKQHNGQTLEAQGDIGQELLDHDESNPTLDRPLDGRYAGGDDDDDKDEGELVIEQTWIGILRIDDQERATEPGHCARKGKDQYPLPGEVDSEAGGSGLASRMAPRYWPIVPTRRESTITTTSTTTIMAKMKN